MAGGNKAGIAGGLLVALGLGGARFLDDCARAGSRGARVLDDAAIGGAAGGARMASWGADDAVRVGGGLDDAAALGLRGAGRVEALAGSHVDDVPWLEAARDGGLEIGIQALTFDPGGEPRVVLTPGEVRCPRFVTVTSTPDEWTQLRGGLGVACAPVVLVGTASADGTALRVGAREVPLTELLGECAGLGARCIAIGCAEQEAKRCEDMSKASLLGTKLQSSLSGYVGAFVEDALTRDPAPVVVAQLAAVDGAARLVVARPIPRNSDGSPQVLPPGPPSRPPHTLVLDYDDFGPQALAGKLLGHAWWQWEAGGSWEPGDRFDVRVVVYRGLTEDEVKAEYPTIEGKADYRYVSYDEAMAFFEEALAEIDGEPTLRRLQEELEALRDRVRGELSPSGIQRPLPRQPEP